MLIPQNIDEPPVTATMQRIRAFWSKHVKDGSPLLERGPVAKKDTSKPYRITPMLDKATIKAIRDDIESGESPRRVAKRYGLSDTICYNIKNRKGRFK